MLDETSYTNIVLSSNPCPICADASGESMTLDEWEASEYGLPGSSARYCEDDCHCILAPEDLVDQMPELDDHITLRGDPDADIGSIIEITPNELSLQETMDIWNQDYGKLPPEIYDMNVMDIESYLEKKMKERGQR